MLKPSTLSLAIALSSLGLLAGCGNPQGNNTAGTTKPAKQVTISAAELEQAGRLAEAADAYAREARTQAGPRQAASLLKAARLQIQLGNPQRATVLLQQIRENALGEEDLLEKRLLQAGLAQTQEAILAFLDLTPAPGLSAELMTRWYQARLNAYQNGNQPLRALEERAALYNWLLDEDARENIKALLDGLNKLPQEQLEAAFSQQDKDLAPWLELALIFRGYPDDPGRFDQDISDWRERFAGLQIDQTILDELVGRVRANYQPPGRVALLLPQSGPFADAAAALRDGFLAAYYADSPDRRPQLGVFDSQPFSTVADTYRQISEQGYEFVVGPLSRNAVQSISRQAELPVPILALNRTGTEDYTPDGFYQFGLPPEEEVRQITWHAWNQGHRKALMLIPEGNWGQRISKAFYEAWTELGGELLETQTYSAKTNDYGNPIIKVANLDESRQRRNDLKRILGGELEYEPRRRQDADFVFVAARPGPGRILRPQLQFHRLGDMPVYASSHIFSGRIDPAADRDLNGLEFADMPWLINEGRPVAEEDEAPATSREAFEQLWQGRLDRYRRLYAMGMDSYQLLSFLPRLNDDKSREFAGNTGMLSLNELAQIQRRLLWARFSGGRPQASDWIQAPQLEEENGELPPATPLEEAPQAPAIEPLPPAQTL